MEVVCTRFTGTRVPCLGPFRGTGSGHPLSHDLWACVSPLGTGRAHLPPPWHPAHHPHRPLGLPGDKPRWLQEGRAPMTAARWLFKTFNFPGSTSCHPGLAPEPLKGCCWFLSEGDKGWCMGSVLLPHGPLLLCCWINDLSFPTLQHLQPEVSLFFLYFIHFIWENPQSLCVAGDL